MITDWVARMSEALMVITAIVGLTTIGGAVVAVTRSITIVSTKAETGMNNLASAVEKLSGAMEQSFVRVHDRLDEITEHRHYLDRRLTRVEQHCDLPHLPR
jgi:hypothetical protein